MAPLSILRLRQADTSDRSIWKAASEDHLFTGRLDFQALC